MIRVWLFLFLLVMSAHAATNVWVSTGEAHGIDPRLLYAISKVESNHSPLAVSVNYKILSNVQLDKLYHMLNNKKIPYNTFTKVVHIKSRNVTEAKQVIYFLEKNYYPSFDIGMMQVNNIHKERLQKSNITLYGLLNEETNLNVAAGILWKCYIKHGSNKNAINAYNGNIVGNPYYTKVSAVLNNLLLPHEDASRRLFYRII